MIILEFYVIFFVFLMIILCEKGCSPKVHTQKDPKVFCFDVKSHDFKAQEQRAQQGVPPHQSQHLQHKHGSDT